MAITDLEVTWTCSNCETQNVDDFQFTSFPWCEGCDNAYDWQDIIPPANLALFNVRLAALGDDGRRERAESAP